MSKNKKIRNKSISVKTLKPKTFIPGANHRYDEEISDIAFKVLVHSYLTNIETGISIEREMRKELKKRIFGRKISEIAFSYYKKVIELADSQPLNAVVMKILEVRWDEYTLVKKHMDGISEESFLNRFNNLISNMKELGWTVDLIETGYKNTFDESVNYIIVDKDYANKFFDQDGKMIRSFYLAARSISNINEMIETAYTCGFITRKEEVKDGLYGLTVYPDNNVPGIPFPPASVTRISLSQR